MLRRYLAYFGIALVLVLAAVTGAQARGGGGRGGGGGFGGGGGGNLNRGGGPNVNQGFNNNVNRGFDNGNFNNNNVVVGRNNVYSNRSNNADIDVNPRYDPGRYGYPGYNGNAFAAGAALGAAAVVGSYASSLPVSTCSEMFVGGTTYYNCGGTYYMPAYQGTQVVYEVVNAPM